MAEIASFEDFVREQDRIYKEKFEDVAPVVEVEGFNPDTFIGSHGFLIAVIHPDEIKERVYSHSRRFKDVAPLIVHEPEVVHTTFLNHEMNMPYNPQTADYLCNIVREAHNLASWSIEIDLPGWLYNRTTVIAKGYSNKPFFDIAMALKQTANEKGVELATPWGSHITAARVLEAINPKDAADLIKLLKEAPAIGLSRPISVRVGYQISTPSGYTYKPIEEFKLR